MSWKTSVENGVTRAVFAYDNGVPVAEHSRVVDVKSGADIEAFISECTAALEKRRDDSAADGALSVEVAAKIEAVLNGK